KPNIHWVGYVDWSVRDFHSYNTEHGATYNSYLIQDEKTVLIDTVKGPFAHQLLNNIRELTTLDKIDYIVCNHAEPDHSGSLPGIVKALPNATLLCNDKCRNALSGYFDISNWKIKIVSPDTPLKIGSKTLQFLDTPMVHWPESMFTYIPEEKLLFSMDAFGQHLASSVRFDDQWDLSDTMREAKTYYANIVVPYNRQVQKTLEEAAKLKIEMIAPSHGLIWRKHIPEIVTAYDNWSSSTYKPRVVIVYDSMWESTTQLAETILDGVNDRSQNIDVQLLHARKCSLTRIATEMLDTPAVAFGSATLNAQMMPAMSAVLTYLKGLKFSKKAAFAFGSSGWGSGGAEQISKWFEEMQWDMVAPLARSRWRPAPEFKTLCFEAGKLLAKQAIALSGSDVPPGEKTGEKTGETS
ncbi:MAG: FprA family A-type flavoprotein, partial [Planctomycetaceae bacterium]|nr:FprA family A-type flavoprotein [Planctomycetaceae bacterium]